MTNTSEEAPSPIGDPGRYTARYILEYDGGYDRAFNSRGAQRGSHCTRVPARKGQRMGTAAAPHWAASAVRCGPSGRERPTAVASSTR